MHFQGIRKERLTSLCNKDKICLTIADNGRGFDIGKLSTSESLGATLIKTLSSQLEGEFEILESSEEKGSIFKVEFTRES